MVYSKPLFAFSEPSLLTAPVTLAATSELDILYKKTQIFDASAGVGPIDVTHRYRFAPMLKVTEMLRKTLLASRELRYPYLQALLNLYDDNVLPKKTKDDLVQKPSNSVLIPSIRPDRPTDEDVCRFLQHHWPSIHLSHTGSSKDRMVWGTTYVSPKDIPDEKIHIAVSLGFHWMSLAKKTNSSSSLTAAQLAFLFSGVTTHELAHNMMGWWGKGLVDSPRNEPIESEVGDFIEEKILGGVCAAIWKKGHVGNFNKALAMGIAVNGNFFEINDALARQVLEFKIYVKLPFISVEDVQPAILQPKTIRAKTTPYANNSLPAIVPPKGLMHGVLWRGMAGDKVRVVHTKNTEG